jgi:hypothetical protein
MGSDEAGTLPEDEEHAFVSGLLLSVFPWWMTIPLEKRYSP